MYATGENLQITGKHMFICQVVREKIHDIKLYIEKNNYLFYLSSDIIASVYRTFLEEYIGAVYL